MVCTGRQLSRGACSRTGYQWHFVEWASRHVERSRRRHGCSVHRLWGGRLRDVRVRRFPCGRRRWQRIGMPNWYTEHHDYKVDRALLRKSESDGILSRLPIGSSESQVLVSVKLKSSNLVRPKTKPLENAVKSAKNWWQIVRLLSCLLLDQLAPNRCHLLPLCQYDHIDQVLPLKLCLAYSFHKGRRCLCKIHLHVQKSNRIGASRAAR